MTAIIRCDKHRRWIASLSCTVCKRPDVQCAHIRRGLKGGTGLKPSDVWTIPLCASCHNSQHVVGEKVFWKSVGIIPEIVAKQLCEQSPSGKVK